MHSQILLLIGCLCIDPPGTDCSRVAVQVEVGYLPAVPARLEGLSIGSLHPLHLQPAVKVGGRVPGETLACLKCAGEGRIAKADILDAGDESAHAK